MCRGLDSIQKGYNRRMLRYPRVVEADTEEKEEKRSKWKKKLKEGKLSDSRFGNKGFFGAVSGVLLQRLVIFFFSFSK